MKHIQNPGISLGVLLVAALSVILCSTFTQLHCLMGVSLVYLCFHNQPSGAYKYLSGYILLWVLVYILPDRVGSALVVVMVTLRMMPMLSIGTVLFAAPPGVIMLAGSKVRLPQEGLIGICILLRFASVIPQEMAAILQGVKARGLLPHWYSMILHPVQSYECFVLPLIIRGLRLSTELTCAAEFRGVEGENERTCIYNITLCPKDLIGAFFYVTGCVVIIMWRI